MVDAFKMTQLTSLTILSFLTFDELNSMRGLRRDNVPCIDGNFVEVVFQTLKYRKNAIADFFGKMELSDEKEFRKFIHSWIFVYDFGQLTDEVFCTNTLNMNEAEYAQYCGDMMLQYTNEAR